ncbi:MAG: hypothetical protein KUG77_27215 [Nannocystaceae bacterium]|nr:hypothetical protein [Nannocystaceae bacterium]
MGERPYVMRWGLVLLLVATACGSGEEDAGSGSTGVGSGTETSTASAATGDSTGLGSTSVPPPSSSDVDTGSSSRGSSSTGSTSESTATTGTSSSGGGGGLGALMGDCGVLDAAALTGDEPGFIVNTLDFGDAGFDYDLLTPGGQAVFDAGNLGGSSLFSEVVSFDVLARCESAELLKTETEIEYDGEGPRTDLLVEFDGTKIGVSVTRAQGFPLDAPYSVTQAQVLLEDKLSDIPLSTANVAPADAWNKQILHVIAYGPMHVESLQAAYGALGPELWLDTVVVVTVTHGEDLFIYTE